MTGNAAVGLATPLSVEGELTIYVAAELRESLRSALASVPPGSALEIDLAGVTEMDSAGVQLLMAARKSAHAAGRALRLARPSPAVAEVFATLRLDAHFADAASGEPHDQP